MMAGKEIEISRIDRRYESYRMKNRLQEKSLLNSILESGIREPLKCVEKAGIPVLMDGFKRLRSALKLKMNAAPVVSLGNDEAAGIIYLLRLSNEKGLSILEQAALVDELSKTQGLSVGDIARQLERSPAWVSLRLGIMGEMSPLVKKEIFAGRFPVRSYMYSVRVFTRVNSTSKTETDKFVSAVSGKGLSTRAIEVLAEGFFKGSAQLKEQILNGNIDWTLNQFRNRAVEADTGLNETETRALKDLLLADSCISRLPRLLRDKQLANDAFFAQADLLADGILSKTGLFVKTMEEFHAERRPKEDDRDTVLGREKEEGNRQVSGLEPQDGKKSA